jgi:hypothetical protein
MNARLGISVAILFLAGRGHAANLCDPSLKEETNSPVSYHMRGERCEGFYAQQVSSISLEIRSLVASFGAFDPARDEALTLAWTAPPGTTGTVRLRAFSFKPDNHYRMDTAVPAGRGSYRWPTDVLGPAGLHSQDLGVIAWIDLPGKGGAPRTVYLPLRVSTGAAAKAAAGYEVTLLPSARLSEVRLTVSRLNEQGQTAAVLRRNEELGYGYYPSNTPTAFSTNKLGPAGFYRVEVTAVPKSGLSVEQDLELYHPGE